MTSKNLPRIVGGRLAPTPIPWQVSSFGVGFAGMLLVPVCGGTILDSKTILTAAHCFDSLVTNYTNLPLSALVKIKAGSLVWHNDPFDPPNKSGQVNHCIADDNP